MRKLLFSLLLVCSFESFADGTALISDTTVLTSLQIAKIYDEQTNKSDITGVADLIDRDEKIAECISVYVKKQSKSYSKKVQHTLYDLLHVPGIYSKKTSNMSYEEKIKALGKVQCDMYYNMRILK